LKLSYRCDFSVEANAFVVPALAASLPLDDKRLASLEFLEMRKDHTHSQDRDINVDWVKRKLSPLLYPVIQQVWREKRLGPQPRPGVLTKESRDRLIKKRGGEPFISTRRSSWWW
jgi:hypothetical protein